MVVTSFPILCYVLLASTGGDAPVSKWVKRTQKRRQRTEQLLSSISPPRHSHLALNIPILDAPDIDWAKHPNLDPQQGGKIKPDSERAIRKRRAVEGFVHIAKQLIRKNHPGGRGAAATIVDCGSGAGNLAVPMAGFLTNHDVLAIDVNEIALQRLRDRCPSINTLCADLASDIQIQDDAFIVVSLHACGAATDMAIRLATRHRQPFCMSPCCTAKAIVGREQHGSSSYGPAAASFHRSGAPADILYPRSLWLTNELLGYDQSLDMDTSYAMLAKVADVGLGPQTPQEQILHQQKAKQIIEWDRLMGVVERHDYRAQMFHLKDHDGYGKKEIFVGIPNEMRDLRDLATPSREGIVGVRISDIPITYNMPELDVILLPLGCSIARRKATEALALITMGRIDVDKIHLRTTQSRGKSQGDSSVVNTAVNLDTCLLIASP